MKFMVTGTGLHENKLKVKQKNTRTYKRNGSEKL